MTRPVLDPAELAFDFRRWVEHNVTIVERAGPEWTVTCPECNRDKLAIHVGRKAWQCWTCGFAGYRPRYLVAAVLGIPRVDADEIIAGYSTGVTLGPIAALAPPPSNAARLLPIAPPPPGMVTLQEAQGAYLAGRGILSDYAYAFGVQTCLGDSSSSVASRLLAGRAIFPAWDAWGRFVFWTARGIGPEHDPKVLNVPRACNNEAHPDECTCNHQKWGIPLTPRIAGKGEVVWGLHLVQPGSRVIVVEGPTDAVTCGPGFVAVGGAGMSIAQAALIAGTGAAEAVVLFDGDEAGIRGAWGRKGRDGRQHSPGAGDILGMALPTRVAVCPEGTDPGSLGREAAYRAAAGAVPVGRTALPSLRVRCTVTDVEKVTATIPLLGPFHGKVAGR